MFNLTRNIVRNTTLKVVRGFAEAAKEAPKVSQPKQGGGGGGGGGGGSAIYVFIAATGAFVYADPLDMKEVKLLKAQLGLLSVDIPTIKNDIKSLIDDVDAARGDGTGIGPTLVRLAWHHAGTYSKEDKTGGSNGATMRFSPEKDWGANAGLGGARDFMEKIKDKHPHVSYSDLWTLAGVASIEHMGGPVIPWRQGRTDSDKPTTVPDGRLPAADKGDAKKTNGGIREVFNRMGFNDQEIVALSGAHALGRCHTNASGYWGPWTRAETTFSNEYFRLLVEEKWTVKKTHEGKPWTGPLQYESKDGSLMMLPSDLALLSDPEFKKHVVAYAKDEALFFKDFSAAFAKLMELGVTFK